MSDTSGEQPQSRSDAEVADSPVLLGERVVFTGTLASMTHREAFERVTRDGGDTTQNVSRQTTMLVLGEEGWPLEEDGQPSQKLLQVLQMQQSGHSCRILQEAEWLHLVGLDERRSEVRGEHTPAMLSRLLKVPVNRIRRWERMGLLQASRNVGRLPLFDYREVTGARRIAELLDSGIHENRLLSAVRILRSVLPDGAASVSEIPVVSQNAKLLYRDGRGLLDPETRQRCFDFGPPAGETSDVPEDGSSAGSHAEILQLADAAVSEDEAATPESEWTAAEWFHQGCRLLEDNRPDSAVEAFRLVLMDRPGDADANFHLAESLYRQGDRHAARERFYAAVEADHEFLEAWTQLGCVNAELDESQSALDAFDVALRIHPDFADAHWHKADLLWRLGRKSESIPHWDDALGPWAETAQQRLEDAGSNR